MKIKEQYALISVFDKINLDFICKLFKKIILKLSQLAQHLNILKK